MSELKLVTTSYFTKKGFRTLPVGKNGCTLERLKDTQKKVIRYQNKTLSFGSAMPSEWTVKYGDVRNEHPSTSLGGLICGPLKDKQPSEIEVVAIDCDNQASWDTLTSLHPDNKFIAQSIGKPGGTIYYLLPPELRELRQYSLSGGPLIFEYMSQREAGANAMVYLPTTANKTKETIPRSAELLEMPKTVQDILVMLKPSEDALIEAPEVAISSGVLPFNAPLVKQYIAECKEAATGQRVYGRTDDSLITRRVYAVYTPQRFRRTASYKRQGWLHPDSSEIDNYPAYIIGVSAIAGADISISPELYLEFMQAFNVQITEPYTTQRYLTEVLNPMMKGKAKINNKPIWKYSSTWDEGSHSISNQRGESLEYFISELEANSFLEFNHVNNSLIPIKGVSAFLDRLYAMDADPEQSKPSKNIVKKLKLVREERTVKKPPGLYMSAEGVAYLNTLEASHSLRILQDPSRYPHDVPETDLYVKSFNLFLTHLTEGCEASIKFIKQVIAYHGKNLKNIPVIFYVVGVGGAGKSEFANMLELLFGANTTRRPGPKQLNSEFNDFLEGCAVLILSETADLVHRDRKGLKSILKTVTGEQAIDIRKMYQSVRPNVPVYALPILLANDFWYETDENDRRIFTLNPSTPLVKAKPVLEFERIHGIRIIKYIAEGIKKGILAKYISGFCPDLLPNVPLTQTGYETLDVALDPIKQVKQVAQTKLIDLIRLFSEYDITDFFGVMNADIASAKAHLYSNHLIQLVQAIRGDALYPGDNEIKKAFTGRNWVRQGGRVKRNSYSGPGYTNYKRAGLYKWPEDKLPVVFERWQEEELNFQGEE